MCYVLCYLTETCMVMNCDTGAMIALSHPMMTSATLFTDKYINTVTKHLGLIPPSFSLMFGCVLSTHTNMLCDMCRDEFGTKHHRYSDALLDYGFFLLNIDCICQAVKVYQMALDIRIAVFGGNNLHVAIAHEDLAYCAYVHEYSSGKFHDARSAVTVASS